LAAIPSLLLASATATSGAGDDPLTIGGCTFAIDEAPSEIAFGVTPIVVKKVAIGGRVRTQTLGSHPKDVAWDGEFFENADSQIAILEALANSQQATTLTWRKPGRIKTYRVIVSDFVVTWYQAFHALYHIAVSVQSNLSSTAKSPAASVDSAVALNLSSASSSYGEILSVDPGASGSLVSQSDIDAAVASIGPVASGSANSGSALTTITTAIGRAQAYLGGLPALSAAVLPATSHLSALRVLSANITRGQSPSSVLVDGASTSLLKLGAQYYPGLEPTISATAIAKANGLASLFLDRGSQKRLILPPISGVGTTA